MTSKSIASSARRREARAATLNDRERSAAPAPRRPRAAGLPRGTRMSAHQRSRRVVIAAGALALALVAAVALVLASADGGSNGKGPESAAPGISSNTGFAGAELPQPPPAYDFTLTDATGRMVS